jgi:hypothetical protein
MEDRMTTIFERILATTVNDIQHAGGQDFFPARRKAETL